MPDSTQSLTWLFLLAAVPVVAAVLKKVLETIVQKSTEQAIAGHNWSRELQRALEKTRAVERQGLRFKCYGALWAALRPLALYDSTPFGRSAAAALSAKLSDWYFSPTGGLLLTREARDYYFALQDLLRAVSTITSEWQAIEGSGDERETLRRVLRRFELQGALATLEYFDAARFDNWSDVALDRGVAWKSDLAILAAESQWLSLQPGERFAVLQQAGSMLRSSLTADIDSRLR